MILGVTSALDKKTTHLLEKKPHLLSQKDIGTTNSASLYRTANTLNSSQLAFAGRNAGGFLTLVLGVLTTLGIVLFGSGCQNNNPVKNMPPIVNPTPTAVPSNLLKEKILNTVIRGMGAKYTDDTLPTMSYKDSFDDDIVKSPQDQNLSSSEAIPSKQVYKVTSNDGTAVINTGTETYYMSGNNLMCRKSGDAYGIVFKVIAEDGYTKYIDPDGKCAIAYKKDAKTKGLVGVYRQLYDDAGAPIMENGRPKMEFMGNLPEFKLNGNDVTSTKGIKQIKRTLRKMEKLGIPEGSQYAYYKKVPGESFGIIVPKITQYIKKGLKPVV